MLKVFLIGNLGADPETRFAPSGQKITSLRVASNSKRQGKEETTWYRVTIFGDRFDKMTAYLKKGSLVVVTGEMTTQLWTDKEGRQHIQNDVIADSISFGPSNRSGQNEQGSNSYGGANNYSQPAAATRNPAPGYAQPTHQQHFAAPTQEFSFGETFLENSPHGENAHGHDEPPF